MEIQWVKREHHSNEKDIRVKTDEFPSPTDKPYQRQQDGRYGILHLFERDVAVFFQILRRTGKHQEILCTFVGKK